MKVFISSISAGLEDLRAQIRHLLATEGHQVIDMLDFGADPARAADVCRERVDEADVVLLIAGPEYGSVDPESGLSFTHIEFNRAKEKGIPVLALLLSNWNKANPTLAQFVRLLSTQLTFVTVPTPEAVPAEALAALHRHVGAQRKAATRRARLTGLIAASVTLLALLALVIAAALAPLPSEWINPSDTAPRGREDLALYRHLGGGTFLMGCDSSVQACSESSLPRHRETLRGYFLMQHEVSAGQYVAFANATNRPSPQAPCFDDSFWMGGPIPSMYFAPWLLERHGAPQATRHDLPAINVTFEDANAYCAYVGARLPTEAEWEYAARAGRENITHVWGDSAEAWVDGWPRANVWDESLEDLYSREPELRLKCDASPTPDGRLARPINDGFPLVAPVGSLKHPMQSANAWGLFDLAGNAWEWVQDEGHGQHHAGTYKSRVGDGRAYQSGSPSLFRVYRGASWGNGDYWIWERSAGYLRRMGGDSAISAGLGFRCAADEAAVRLSLLASLINARK